MMEGCNLKEDQQFEDITVGNRVVCDGNKATVLYMGDVEGTRGDWIGLDWDDPSRGKHGGVHSGKSYFTTSFPTSGSFVRPNKIKTGTSVFEAIRNRYCDTDDEEDFSKNQEDLYVKGKGRSFKPVEFIGADQVSSKQSKLDKLREVALRDMNISHVSPGRLLAHHTPNITELDISDNLVYSWEMVAMAAEQLKKLHLINVSDNKIKKLPDKCKHLSHCLSGVTTLLLNRMNYTWEQAVTVARMFPSVEHLHLCFNSISRLCDPADAMNNLKLLNLEGNALTKSSELWALGQLPCLEYLIINHTDLSEFSLPPGDSPISHVTIFPNLKEISMLQNHIDKWHSINELNRLPRLVHLNFARNPLNDSLDKETLRELVIAKIGTLTQFNRSKVPQRERMGAELDYLKRFGRDWLDSGGNRDPSLDKSSAAFLSEHPRYLQLVKEYGAPHDSELYVHDSAIKSSLISVRIKCLNLPDKEPVQKKLLGTMSVQKLRALVQRMYSVNPQSIIISYISQQMPGHRIRLDNDLRQISHYSIEDGDTIIVRW